MSLSARYDSHIEMQAFDSIAKKLAIPMVVLFEIGWIVFIGGFGSYMHQVVLQNAEIRREYGSTSAPNADEVLRTPVLFPYYFVLVCGQFVALLLFLHASLPSSIASYIVGVLSSILNVIYFVSVGFLIQWSVFCVKYYEEFVSSFQQSPNSLYSLSGLELERAILYLHAVRCIFAGTFLMAISWGVIQLLFFFYEPQIDSQNQRSLWLVIQEFATDLPSSISLLKTKLGELFRICTIPLLAISLIGWCVCAARLYKLADIAATYVYTITNYSLYYDFGTWATLFVTPLLFLAALLHAGCSYAGGTSTMSGIFAAILNTFFILSMGSAVVSVCITKYHLDHSTLNVTEDIQQVIYNADLILGGGVVCLFFWTIVHSAWPFYRCKGSTDHTRLQSNQEDDHAQFVSQNEYDETSFSPEQLPPSTKRLHGS